MELHTFSSPLSLVSCALDALCEGGLYGQDELHQLSRGKVGACLLVEPPGSSNIQPQQRNASLDLRGENTRI